MHPSLSNSTAPQPEPLAFASLAGPAPQGVLRIINLFQALTRFPRTVVLFSLVLFCLPIWLSLGDHGFNGRSDARYAVVAQDMASSNDWLVPRYMGHVHLTKPPLVYWLESASVDVFGHTYFAVRLPSAISGTLAIVLLYWFASRLRGRREALFACGMYAIMPMTILPARMTVTDSVLNLCWMMTIFGAYLADCVPEQRRTGRVLLWLGVCLGLLAKGPVMFIPMGVVLVWWICRRERIFARRQTLIWIGAALSTLVPVLLWAVSVVLVEPEAAGIWWHETYDRAVGQGDHSRPLWFFVPVLLAGCFPCSAMLVLPGINLRLPTAWDQFRNGSLEGLLGFAVIGPFLVYSLISGKLPSYLLPICAPLAMLSAMMLSRWFSASQPAPGDGRRLPEVRLGLMIGTLLFMMATGGAIFWFYGLQKSLLSLGLLPALLIALLMVRYWPLMQLRMPLMACFLASWIVGWTALEEIEDIALADVSYAAVAQEIFGESGWQGRVGIYQLEAGIIYWEREGVLEQYSKPNDLAASLDDRPMLVLTQADRWEKLGKTNPNLYAQGNVVHDWRQFPGAPKRYLVVFNDVGSGDEAP